MASSTGMLVAVVCCCLVTLACAAEGGSRSGGRSDVSQEDLPKIPQAVVDAGKDHLVSLTNAPCRESYTLVSAQTQVVNGKNYFLTFKADTSHCQNGQGIQTCTVTVWYKLQPNEVVTPKDPNCQVV